MSGFTIKASRMKANFLFETFVLTAGAKHLKSLLFTYRMRGNTAQN